MTAWASWPTTGSDNLGTIAVVLGVIGRVDHGLDIRIGLREGHVSFGTTGPDAADAAGRGAAKPRIFRSVGRANVEVVVESHDPHRYVRPQRARRAASRRAAAPLPSRFVADPGGVQCGHWESLWPRSCPPYSASVTWSPQCGSPSVIERWVMKWSWAAPCQCSSASGV